MTSHDKKEFIHFLPNQLCNKIIFKTEDQEDGGFKELRGKDQYVVFADYSPDSLEFIKDPKYHSYADILNELKGKLEGYLPDDFPWDERIGRYSYAMNA